jgi:hypothetical protein
MPRWQHSFRMRWDVPSPSSMCRQKLCEMPVEDYAHYRRGEASALTQGVQDATGKAPRTFSAFARDYAPAFS